MDDIAQHDTLIDTAYDIFLELAFENLNQTDTEKFNAEFEQSGVLELYTPNEDWLEYLETETLETIIERFVEIVVGLNNDKNQLTECFARILLPLAQEEKECYIIWKE